MVLKIAYLTRDLLRMMWKVTMSSTRNWSMKKESDKTVGLWINLGACVCFVCVSNQQSGLLFIWCTYLPSDLRRVEVETEKLVSVARTDMVSQAKGSAYIEMKKTKVVCSVFDPREIPHQNEFRCFFFSNCFITCGNRAGQLIINIT